MARRWQYSGFSLFCLSIGLAAIFLTASRGGSAPSAPDGVTTPELQALLQKVESLDTTKPEALATLKGSLAELIRIVDGQLKQQATETAALRAEMQATRAAPAAATSTRTSRGSSAPKQAAAAVKSAPGDTASTQLYGKTGLKKLHRTGCQFGDRIKEGDRVYFKSVQDASAAGYEPCKVCRPGG